MLVLDFGTSGSFLLLHVIAHLESLMSCCGTRLGTSLFIPDFDGFGFLLSTRSLLCPGSLALPWTIAQFGLFLPTPDLGQLGPASALRSCWCFGSPTPLLGVAKFEPLGLQEIDAC